MPNDCRQGCALRRGQPGMTETQALVEEYLASMTSAHPTLPPPTLATANARVASPPSHRPTDNGQTSPTGPGMGQSQGDREWLGTLHRSDTHGRCDRRAASRAS